MLQRNQTLSQIFGTFEEEDRVRGAFAQFYSASQATDIIQLRRVETPVSGTRIYSHLFGVIQGWYMRQ